MPRSVSLTGSMAFHFADELASVSELASIDIIATEYNFSPPTRSCEYLAADGTWKDAGCRDALFHLTSDFQGWEGREALTLRYTAASGGEEYMAIHTVFKLTDVESAYTVYVESKNGTTFRNGVVSTVLRARVYKGGEEITAHIPDSGFHWYRTSVDRASDEQRNATPHYGQEITITGEDVWRKAVFDCEVGITNNR